MDFNKIFQSVAFKVVIFSVAALTLALFIFKVGMMVGQKKADFSYKWSENYHRNFGGPRGGFFRDFGGSDFIEGHGVVGQIIKIDGKTLVIKGQNDVEKIVLIKDDTAIKHSRENIKYTDLKTGDRIVAIGEPNDAGQTEAKLIRILPLSPIQK